jgi:hypothetical protein
MATRRRSPARTRDAKGRYKRLNTASRSASRSVRRKRRR